MTCCEYQFCFPLEAVVTAGQAYLQTSCIHFNACLPCLRQVIAALLAVAQVAHAPSRAHAAKSYTRVVAANCNEYHCLLILPCCVPGVQGAVGGRGSSGHAELARVSGARQQASGQTRARSEGGGRPRARSVAGWRAAPRGRTAHSRRRRRCLLCFFMKHSSKARDRGSIPARRAQGAA